MDKPRVFLDTSIFITALLSNRGGAFYILDVLKDRLTLHTNEYVLTEIEDVLTSKFADRSDMRTHLFLMMGATPIAILPHAPMRELAVLKDVISEKDAPILASALAHSSYLLTLDNEFFNQRIHELAVAKGLTILKPKECIALFRA